MTQIHGHPLKPFLSVCIIIGTLFVIAFCKMEVRRMGYQVLRTSREVKKEQDNYRVQMIAFAKITRPERIEAFAQTKLAMQKATQGQIIQIAGGKVAVRAQ